MKKILLVIIMFFCSTAMAAENRDNLFIYIQDEQPGKETKFLLYNQQKIFYQEPAILTDKDVIAVYEKYNSHMSRNMTTIEFADVDKVHKLTKDNVHKLLIIAVNSEVVCVARLMAEITDGKMSVLDTSPTTDLVAKITKIISNRNH